MDCFLYDSDLRHERVNDTTYNLIKTITLIFGGDVAPQFYFSETSISKDIISMFSPNLIFLVGSSFRRACFTRIINCPINVNSWKMQARFIPLGFGILSTFNLMKEVSLQIAVMLFTLKNFLELIENLWKWLTFLNKCWLLKNAKLKDE